MGGLLHLVQWRGARAAALGSLLCGFKVAIKGLSSVPESELGRNAPKKNLGRFWQIFPPFSAFGREIIPRRSDRFVFFPISCVRSESDVFERPSNRQRSSKTKSLILLLQPICHLLGRFGEDRLCGLGDREQNNKHKNERSYSTIEDAGLIIIRPFNNVFYI